MIVLIVTLMLQPILSIAKPESFLSAIQEKLEEQILSIEDRVFDPQIYIYNNDPSGWCATVNNDYLRGVVTVFEAADLIPAKAPKIPFYESKEFGFVVGVLSTAVLIYLIK